MLVAFPELGQWFKKEPCGLFLLNDTRIRVVGISCLGSDKVQWSRKHFRRVYWVLQSITIMAGSRAVSKAGIVLVQ